MSEDTVTRGRDWATRSDPSSPQVQRVVELLAKFDLSYSTARHADARQTRSERLKAGADLRDYLVRNTDIGPVPTAEQVSDYLHGFAEVLRADGGGRVTG